MTEQEANDKLLEKEDKYFHMEEGITKYAAVVKRSDSIMNYKQFKKIKKQGIIKDDYVIEIGIQIKEEFKYHVITKMLRDDNIFKKDFKKENIQFNPLNDNFLFQNTNVSRERFKKITGGVSVCNEDNPFESGTLGAFFKMEDINEIFFISNYHVLVRNIKKTNRLPILKPKYAIHPSHADAAGLGLQPTDMIMGELFWNCKENLDVAICKVINNPVIDEGKYTRCEEVKFDGIGSPKIDKINKVKKCGRTTGFTNGNIKSVNCTVNISNKDGEMHLFRNQILTDKMSEKGDSGSILVDKNNKVVGLLFAGNSIATVYNNFSNIIKKAFPNNNFQKFI